MMKDVLKILSEVMQNHRKLVLMVLLVISGLLSVQVTHWTCSVYSHVSVRKRLW